MTKSIYWYDLETTGTSPAWDRIVQFAGLRTSSDLKEVSDEYETRIQLSDETLIHPAAAAVHGFTHAACARGLTEWQAMQEIMARFAAPGTCVAGFNSVRFDDEFIRYGLYRNLMDPYAREWQNGNSRWDILDLARATRALRPEGINWPTDAEGLPRMRLEQLAEANGLTHPEPHQALSDVRATVALAGLIRDRQPRLYNYAFQLRSKKQVEALLMPLAHKPLAHVSGRLPRARYHLAPVISIGRHPEIPNSVIVANLCDDPEPLLCEPAEALREALFATGDDANALRPPLKEIRLNRCPFLAPIETIRPVDAERLEIDLDAVAASAKKLREALPELAAKVRQIYANRPFAPAADVEGDLYRGFVSDRDRRACDSVQQALHAGRWQDPDFQDPRLPPLAFRLKARQCPELLSDIERETWRAWVRRRLSAPEAPWMTLQKVSHSLAETPADTQKAQERLDAIRAHLHHTAARYGCDLPEPAVT